MVSDLPSASLSAVWANVMRRFRNQDPVGSGWPPVLWLLYLGFLFIPFSYEASWRWLWATLVSLLIFFALFTHYLFTRWKASLFSPLALAALSFALQPFNGFANTYLVYAAALAPLALPGLLRPMLLTIALLILQAVEITYLGQTREIIAITAILCVAVCAMNAFAREKRAKDAALRLSQDEVRRLAAIAERERIGRDLHDLLGHTLSLVALKGELAGKLIRRDPDAAEREIGDVTQIARDALTQVRTAVTGMRAAALAGELASARALLESSGVELTCRQQAAQLPAPIETALAMIVREAATNIQRHACATRATFEIENAVTPNGPAVALRVSDNGRGGIGPRGNGLAGISERVRLLGGTLEIDSPPGSGTMLCARLPVNP